MGAGSTVAAAADFPSSSSALEAARPRFLAAGAAFGAAEAAFAAPADAFGIDGGRHHHREEGREKEKGKEGRRNTEYRIQTWMMTGPPIRDPSREPNKVAGVRKESYNQLHLNRTVRLFDTDNNFERKLGAESDAEPEAEPEARPQPLATSTTHTQTLAYPSAIFLSADFSANSFAALADAWVCTKHKNPHRVMHKGNPRRDGEMDGVRKGPPPSTQVELNESPKTPRRSRQSYAETFALSLRLSGRPVLPPTSRPLHSSRPLPSRRTFSIVLPVVPTFPYWTVVLVPLFSTDQNLVSINSIVFGMVGGGGGAVEQRGWLAEF